MYAALPSGMEMLFLFAFAIGRHSSAALVHFSFLMLLPALTVLYGIRFGLPRGSAAFAAIVVFVTPLVGWDGSIAYNDVALTVVGFAAVYFLQMWRSDRFPANLMAACALAGFRARHQVHRLFRRPVCGCHGGLGAPAAPAARLARTV